MGCCYYWERGTRVRSVSGGYIQVRCRKVISLSDLPRDFFISKKESWWDLTLPSLDMPIINVTCFGHCSCSQERVFIRLVIWWSGLIEDVAIDRLITSVWLCVIAFSLMWLLLILLRNKIHHIGFFYASLTTFCHLLTQAEVWWRVKDCSK